MPVTVLDCLKLSSLSGALVLGGAKGLDRQVVWVTVLETTILDDLRPEYIRPRQLAISSFVAIRDDVDAQCSLIKMLSEADMSGLILFKLGIFVSQIDDKLVKTADALNFPLICIDPSRSDILYANVIHDVV